MNRGKLILVCDDDEIFRTFLLRVLKSSNLPAIAASGGDEAIDILDSNGENIALVLVDLLMPVRSGWEVIDFIKKHDGLAKIPVIAITGLAPDPVGMEKIEQHCAAVVYKGGNFDVEELIKKITKLIS